MKNRYIERGAAYLSAIILLQTLYFKFTGHPDSVAIFSMLGVEPYGRVGLGVIELITAILLIIPRTAVFGSILGLGIISGAIVSHLFIIGINVNDDGGALFGLAVLVFLGCALVLFKRKDEALSLIGRG